jgi:hypothetical protein
MSYIDIPTFENNEYSITSFDTREDYKNFVLSLFREPGKYEFDETSDSFNTESKRFNELGFYCASPLRSKDYKTYWDDQKDKCRKGVIYKNGDKTWYITRDYYMWLNFLPIFDKEEQKFGFAKVRDAQYHMALYEILAELNYKHCAILKKRQIASSYFHCAKIINQIWFEEGVTLKIGAELKDYINEKGSWAFFNEYRNFLNGHTGWYRPFTPDKVLNWEQKISVRQNNQDVTKGLKGRLIGLSFDKNPTNGVGGPVKYFFHEEAGIAPKMNVTYEFIRPAMGSGFITTGTFIAAGSVGDLDQCEPLKELIYNPDVNDIYSVETDLLDDKGTIGRSGLFIPEQWSMPPYIDEFGNSLVEEALIALDEQFEKWKKELEPEQYQLRISQRPRNIAEAFAARKESKFPVHLVTAQTRRIEDKEYPYELLDLERDAEGKIFAEVSRRVPIKHFPIKKTEDDKEGAFQVWERPKKDPTFGMYYASIDPVSEGKTTTSESLCSIYVYKAPVEVIRETSSGKETYFEKDKIVAAWCGRYDDLSKTHEKLELIIEWYNAWTIVENNISLFIQYMIEKRKQKYLVPKNQILFLKDLGANANVFQEYGWKNTGILFKSHLLSYLIQFLTEEIDHETKPDGTIVKTTYGIERIPDKMAMVEMLAYRDGLNVDRLVSLAALISFARIQISNRGFTRKYETDESVKLQNSNNLYKLNSNPFKFIGNSKQPFGGQKMKRNPFKNFR